VGEADLAAILTALADKEFWRAIILGVIMTAGTIVALRRIKVCQQN